MPLGEGWWLNPDWRLVEIHDHLLAVTQDAGKFGLTAALVKRRPREGYGGFRTRVLTAAMRKSWIRVRSHGGATVFETWRRTPATTAAIMDFIEQVLQPGPAGRWAVHELAKARRPPRCQAR